MADSSGIDGWIEGRGYWRVGIDRGDGQCGGILVRTCWLSVSCMPALSGENAV